MYEIGRATQVGRLNTDVSFNAELCTFLDTQRVKYLYSFRSDTGSISTRNPTIQRMTGYAYIQSGSGLFLFFVALTGNGKLWALPDHRLGNDGDFGVPFKGKTSVLLSRNICVLLHIRDSAGKHVST